MSLDYTVIPRSIRDTIESGSEPLSEEQFLLMAGALATIQMQIESFGLEGAIEVMTPMAEG